MDDLRCLVSIGTGVPSLTPFGDDVGQIGKALLAIALDTEVTADAFQRHHPDLYKNGKAFRFNVNHGLENIGLEDVSKMKNIFGITRSYFQKEDTFNKMEACAERLKGRGCTSQYR